ncbi:hypothetical protein JMJ77_0014222, partial [Colletotrichum scovillei]
DDRRPIQCPQVLVTTLPRAPLVFLPSDVDGRRKHAKDAMITLHAYSVHCLLSI